MMKLNQSVHKELLLFIFLSVFTLSSCVQTVEFDGVSLSQKLVLVSEINPDNKVEISLSTAVSSSDDNVAVETPRNAEIKISGSGLNGTESNFSYIPETGKYESIGDFKPSEGGEYILEAFIPGSSSGIVTSTTKVPVATQIELLSATQKPSIEQQDGLSRRIYEVVLQLPEYSSEVQYLHIIPKFERYELYTFPGQDDFYSSTNQFFNFNADKFSVGKNAVEVLNHKAGFLVDLSKLDDGYLRLNLSSSIKISDSLDGILGVDCEVLNVSREYYMYNSTLSKQLDLLNTPFTAPTTSFTNVEGGYGVFAGFSSAYQSFPFQ